MIESNTRNDSIFIVDDCSDNIKILEAILSDLNYSVRAAVRGPSAIKSIQQAVPDLVLLDIKMPDMDGYEVCRRLRNDKATENIPIIFISGLNETEDKVKAFHVGGNDYITKPFQVEEISARIQAHLSIRKMQKKLESNNVKLLQENIERKQAEKLILKSEERYSSIINDVLDTSNVGVFLLDKEFRVVWVNKIVETYFGLKRDEIVGKDNRQFINDKIYKIVEDGNRFMQTVLSSYDNNVSEENFICHILADSGRKERWLEYWSKPISSGLYSGGRVEQYTDITKIKLAEEALMKSEKNKAMGIMVSGVAHEFNNILAIISSNVQLLEETHEGDNELSQALSVISRVTDDGAEIVNRMYEFTNTQTDTTSYTNLDMYDLVNQVVDFTRPRWRKMAQVCGINYQIVWGTDMALPLVYGCQTELREVILNIINNALDAMPDGGAITVKARYDQGEESVAKKNDQFFAQDSIHNNKFVEISFTDTGKGMTEEEKKSIFDPFFTTKSPEGTGLGMSVSYGIIVRHGGVLSVESELGKGSTVSLSLPVSDNALQHVVKSRQDINLNIKNLAILVVDDEIVMCEALKKFLHNLGHKVCGVNNGVQAIELLKKNDYDLLICDLVMPEVNGRDVIYAIKDLNVDKRPKVGLITGWKFNIDDAEKEGLNVDFIIQKPFDLYKLLQDINDLWA